MYLFFCFSHQQQTTGKEDGLLVEGDDKKQLNGVDISPFLSKTTHKLDPLLYIYESIYF